MFKHLSALKMIAWKKSFWKTSTNIWEWTCQFIRSRSSSPSDGVHQILTHFFFPISKPTFDTLCHWVQCVFASLNTFSGRNETFILCWFPQSDAIVSKRRISINVITEFWIEILSCKIDSFGKNKKWWFRKLTASALLWSHMLWEQVCSEKCPLLLKVHLSSKLRRIEII